MKRATTTKPLHEFTKSIRAPRRPEPRDFAAEDREKSKLKREKAHARAKPGGQGLVIEVEANWIGGEKLQLEHVPATNDQLDIDGVLSRCIGVTRKIVSGRPTVVTVRLCQVSTFGPS